MAGFDWFLMAMLVLAVASIGLVVQPAIVYIMRRQTPLPGRAAFRSAIGPGLAFGLASAALASSSLRLELETRRTMDLFAFVLPVAALVLWIAATLMALRRAGSRDGTQGD